MFVSNKELKEHFNCGTNPKLIRTLERNGLAYMVDAKGNPIMLASELQKGSAGATKVESHIEFAGVRL